MRPGPPPAPFDLYLDTEPVPATAFLPEGGSAVTPFRLRLEPGERKLLKLVSADHKDMDLLLDADEIAARYGPPVEGCRLLRVQLTSARSATLLVETTPEGAEVFLDGNRVGSTPIVLSNLTPGLRALRLAHPDCFPHSEELLLPPGQTLRAERRLESRVIPLYRELIRKEPAVMTHYAELAHLFVLRGEFAHAAEVFNQGVEALATLKTTEARRFFMEIERTYTRWYRYPEETPQNQIRPALRETVQRCLDRKAAPASTCRALLTAMDNYDHKFVRSAGKR